MKISNIVFCALALGFSAGAFAQATSNVNAYGKIEQKTEESEDSIQEMYIGTVKSGGGSRTSNVTITSTGRIYQSQVEAEDSLQSMKIGHVEADGSSNVTITGVVGQVQGYTDDDAHQDMKIGVVEGRGTTRVTVRDVTQWQWDVEGTRQSMNIGSILK